MTTLPAAFTLPACDRGADPDSWQAVPSLTQPSHLEPSAATPDVEHVVTVHGDEHLCKKIGKTALFAGYLSSVEVVVLDLKDLHGPLSDWERIKLLKAVDASIMP